MIHIIHIIHEIILFIIDFYFVVVMIQDKPKSSSSNNKNKRNRNKKSNKNEQQQQMPMLVPAIKNIQFPEYIKHLNYYSVEALQNNIEDQITNKAFHSAILQNQHLFVSKIVMHITEGINCLYSIFGAQAGASKVYCVINGQSQKEQQNLYMMKQIIKQNDLQQIIEVLPWRCFNAEVDVIVAEPNGYCLYFDGLLDRIIEARDLYLCKEGLIFPNVLSFKCALIDDEYFADHKINYWNDVYGIPMISMKKWISHQPIIKIVDPNLIVSRVAKVITFDLQTVTYQDIININQSIQIDLLGSCRVNGLCIWFQTFFNHCHPKIDLKASPWAQSTKYTQVTLYWPQIVQFNGGKLRIRLKGHKYPKEGYSIITTEIDDKTYQYCFS